MIMSLKRNEDVHLRGEKDQKDQLEESEEADILLASKTEDHASTIDSYDGYDGK